MTGKRKEALPLVVGSYFRHRSPTKSTTIWRLVSLESEESEAMCKIQLLSSTKDWDVHSMKIGDECPYQKEVLRWYHLWEVIPEEDAVLAILGDLP